MKYVFSVLNVVITLAGHWLVFVIYKYYFEIENIYTLMAVAGILMMFVSLAVIAPLLIHWRDNILSRSLYLIVGLWIGVMLNIVLTAGVLALIGSAGLTLDAIVQKWIIAVMPYLMLLPEAWAAQAHRIKRAEVKIKDLPDAWVGKIVVHLSDIHLGPIWRQRFFDRLVEKVKSLKSDAVFITGDLFDGMDSNFDWFQKRHFQTPLGVYYSFGNHDLNLGAERVRSLLSTSGIRILDNELVNVAGLQILGLTCYNKGRLDMGNRILTRVGYDMNQPSILMYHEPLDIKAAREAGIDLELSGHTHGGQMFPMDIVANILYKGFGGGLYRLPGFTLSVSFGAGTWGPPLRLGSRSDIVVLKLLKA